MTVPTHAFARLRYWSFCCCCCCQGRLHHTVDLLWSSSIYRLTFRYTRDLFKPSVKPLDRIALDNLACKPQKRFYIPPTLKCLHFSNASWPLYTEEQPSPPPLGRYILIYSYRTTTAAKSWMATVQKSMLVSVFSDDFRQGRREARSWTSQRSAEPLYARIKDANREAFEGKPDF